MAGSTLADIEELTLCSCCKRPFDEGDRAPKLLACKHHFCLTCVRTVLCPNGSNGEVCCVHCWKRTTPPDGRADRLPTHGALVALTRRLHPDPDHCLQHALPILCCVVCGARACRACAHPHPQDMRLEHEARAIIARDTRDVRSDLSRLVARRRDFLLRALDAATVIKLGLEAELAAPITIENGHSETSVSMAAADRERLRTRRSEALLQCRLDDVTRAARLPLDFSTIRRALSTPPMNGEPSTPPADPLLFLANYCTAQLYARRGEERTTPVLVTEAAAEAGGSPNAPTASASGVSPIPSMVRAPTSFPLYYFELEVNGAACGRIVVEVRTDVAPRMARNFAALVTGELGVGYRGCTVFQCWENESVITGDFELNNGRGGRSVFEESYFMPDDTRMAAVRGAVGMRRSQKRHDNLGLVGSQFRIVLREMRGFTAIFAFVVEGLELVDRLSRTGDSAGKPSTTILISDCGKLL